MHLYRAYGLAIASECALPELLPADFTTGDVTIRRGRIDRPLSEATSAVFDVGPEEAYLAWSEVGAFRVENGKTILADLRPGIPDELARLPLLAAVLAVLLYQRGLLVLHASAVAVAGRAAIFVGHKGAGKSTMAAALVARGHQLIADDIVAVDCTGGDGPKIVPGYPQLKLFPPAATASFGERGEELPPIHPWSEKRYRMVGDDFIDRPVPPGRVYALARGGGLCKIVSLTPQEMLMTLLQHSYEARLGGSRLMRGRAAGEHLQRCAALVEHARVVHLEVPESLRVLDRVAHVVEADVTGITALRLKTAARA